MLIELSDERMEQCKSVFTHMNYLATKIEKILKSTPMDKVGVATKSNQERTRAGRIVDFFKLFEKAVNVVRKEKGRLEDSLKGANPKTLSDLEEMGMRVGMLNIRKQLKVLSQYEGVAIVDTFGDEQRRYIKERVVGIHGIVFKSLKGSLPGVEPLFPKYFRFVCRNSADKNKVIEEYSRIIFNRYKIAYKNSKFDEFVYNLEVIRMDLIRLDELGSLIFKGVQGGEERHNHACRMVLVSMRDAVRDMVSSVDPDESSEFALKVVKVLNILLKFVTRSDFDVVDSSKDLCFECFKGITEGVLESIENKDKAAEGGKEEDFIKRSNVIIDAFSAGGPVCVEHVGKGIFPGVENLKGLKREILKKCYEKILKLSRPLPDIGRSVYLINNLSVIMIKSVDKDKKRAKSFIVDQINEIVQVWGKFFSRARKSGDAEAYIVKRIKRQEKYSLPEAVRKRVVSNILDVMVRKGETNDGADLFFKLRKRVENLFLKEKKRPELNRSL